MKDVTLKQLTFLAETVRTGSLAGAASALHVTGPAIAQQLRLLEKQVGLPLIERGPGGQRATDAGRLLVEAKSRIQAELDSCDQEIESLRSARAGHVTVGAVSTAKYFAPFVIAAFMAHNPGVTVGLSVGNRDSTVKRLESYEIDIALMGRPPRGLVATTAVFGEHPYVVVSAPDHPLTRRRHIPLSALATETLLVREPGSGTRTLVDALFAASESQLRVGREIESNETIKQAVMAGLGIAMISAHTVAAEVGDGRLAVLSVEGLPVWRDWLVVRMSRRVVSPAAQLLWDFVVTQAGSLLPDVKLADSAHLTVS